MKLAEALLLRVEYRERRDALTKRVHSNLKVQEGDAPHEDPAALLREALELEERMGALVKAIDRTNARARLADGRPLTEALADRETLRQKRLLLSQTLEEAQKRDYRLTHSGSWTSCAGSIGSWTHGSRPSTGRRSWRTERGR